MAFGLLLVLEGVMPMLSPSCWRRLFEEMLQLQDGQIRFFGMFLVLLGLVLVWWAD